MENQEEIHISVLHAHPVHREIWRHQGHRTFVFGDETMVVLNSSKRKEFLSYLKDIGLEHHFPTFSKGKVKSNG